MLREMLRGQCHLGPALSGALEAMELARFDDLPDAQLPWAEIVDAARRQGCSEADAFWDRSGRFSDDEHYPRAA